jgi:hypothetical protein
VLLSLRHESTRAARSDADVGSGLPKMLGGVMVNRDVLRHRSVAGGVFMS